MIQQQDLSLGNNYCDQKPSSSSSTSTSSATGSINVDQEPIDNLKYEYAEEMITTFLICPKCQDPLIDPMTHTPCKTTYCSKCIHMLMNESNTTNKNCCPKCSETFDFKKNCFKSHQKIQSMLDQLKVKCDLCKSIVLRGELKDHKDKYCSFNQLKQLNQENEQLKLKLQELNQENEQLKGKLLLVENFQAESLNKPIHLNVGGSIVTVSLGTFLKNEDDEQQDDEREPDNLFKNMLTGKYPLHKTPSKRFDDPIYFIDCKPMIFDHILEWLQFGRLATELSTDMKYSLLDACQKFKLKNLSKKLLEQELHKKETMKISQFVNLINLSKSKKIGLNLSGHNLTQLVLQSTNLERSEIISSEFSGMNLTQANFKNSILRGCNFSGCNLTGVDFNGCDLSECDFSNAILNSTDLSNALLFGTCFENAKFENKTKFQSSKFEKTLGLNGNKLVSLDISKSTIVECSFNDSDLSNSNFTGTTLLKCNLENTVLKGSNFENSQFKDVNFTNAILDGSNFENVTFDKCIIQHHLKKDMFLKDCNFISCTFNGSTFEEIDFNVIESLSLKTSFHDCTFKNCNLSLLKDLSKFKGNKFNGCWFNFEQFTNKTIENIEFNNIDFPSQTWKMFEFKNVKYQNCKLDSISVTPLSSIVINDNITNAIMSHTKSQSIPQLLYRGTRDGFKAIDFHSRCDHQGPTLTIIKSVEHNQVFGGFTTKSWISPPYYYPYICISDSSAFIFKIDENNQFKKFNILNRTVDEAIYADKKCLPVFGCCDIRIVSDCNLNNTSISDFGAAYELPTSDDEFKYGSEKAQNYLAGSFKFKVSEIEVFKIIIQ